MAEEYTKNQLAYLRAKGVGLAWKNEQKLIQNGRGTRQWTLEEQKEILETGRCKGYEGHHMASVKNHPNQASNPKNIQFLCSKKENNEHLKAHKGDYSNQTEWRYNPKANTYRPIDPDNPRAQYSYELQDKAIEKRGYKEYDQRPQEAREKTSPAKRYAGEQKKEQVPVRKDSPAVKNVNPGSEKKYARRCEDSRGQSQSSRREQSAGHQGQSNSQRR